jgi:hypothetical protein
MRKSSVVFYRPSLLYKDLALRAYVINKLCSPHILDKLSRQLFFSISPLLFYILTINGYCALLVPNNLQFASCPNHHPVLWFLLTVLPKHDGYIPQTLTCCFTFYKLGYTNLFHAGLMETLTAIAAKPLLVHNWTVQLLTAAMKIGFLQ